MSKSRCIQVYVGLNDSETKEQKFTTEKYIDILRDVCRNYHVAFSFTVAGGGYFHEDGSYVDETSLVLTLMGAEEETVAEIAKDLCVFFRQESVMVTSSEAETFFVEERI